ncbi:UDP-glucose 4-epimerase GalE [Spirochaetia bacterium 38H-sp]|uniref:UDP-glucose 4-epimerase n=1 Tax=Rarispira pelagica TaxID=3141764 RepID=A0ABU9UDM7_9SPIR
MKLLLTGGAGYIGSHTYRLLKAQGHTVKVYDNLSNGHAEAVETDDLIVGSIQHTGTLKTLLETYKPDVVIHFAAFIEVGVSVKKPFEFFANNTEGTLALTKAMLDCGVNKLIFSSTAAVYGYPETTPIRETAKKSPVNPYGTSKLMVEELLESLSQWAGLKYTAIRYFNAAGASEDASIGEAHNPETHLIPLILKTATGERKSISIFGTDFPTPDGTAIRDYIHVDDLARAHMLAADYLADGGKSDVFNCGYSEGYSVREVIEAAKKVTGKDFPVEETERRDGDPAILIADSSKIKQTLGWQPVHNDLEYIIKTAYKWEQNRKY